MALTYIAVLGNFTDKQMVVANLEDGNEEVCAAGRLDNATDLWIPWAPSKDEYAKKKKLAVGFTGESPVYWIWEQNGDVYYCSQDNWELGVPMDGFTPGKGGRRALEFTKAATGGQSLRMVDIK